MGNYLNPRAALFRRSLETEPFVDKSMLIDRLNRLVMKDNCYVCVSRPRRFGKTRALNMLAAYYGKTDSAHLFENLKIRRCPSFEKHLNKYNVIKLDMLDYFGKNCDAGKALEYLTDDIFKEFSDAFEGIQFRNPEQIGKVFEDAFSSTGYPFVILIDEWDAVFRNYPEEKDLQQKFLDFLRGWLKDRDYVALVYMTGILPIKKYGTHSALNMFSEYSMTNPRELAPYYGFTEEDVQELCAHYGMDYSEMKNWYDGYCLSYVDDSRKDVNLSIYNPKSVAEAINAHRCGSYWVNTESYEALEIYFRLNIEGLQDDIVGLLSGEELDLTPSGFPNTLTDFGNKSDVLTLLVHLGYLTYESSRNGESGKVRIPNREVAHAFDDSVRRSRDYKELRKLFENSEALLYAILKGNEEFVAKRLEDSHYHTSVLEYNSESALKYTILLSLFSAAIDSYDTVQELPAGKGYADIAYIPKPGVQKPALLMELKWNKGAESAISQIKEKNYPKALESYRGNLILCGVSYDPETKKHSCSIESMDCR